MPSESPADLTSKTAADREGAPTRREAAPPPEASDAKPFPKAQLRGLVGIYLGLALIVPMIGLGIVYLHAPRLQEQTFADLSAVAELKVGQIESWLDERRGDAAVLAASPGFIEHAGQLLASGDAVAKEHVVERLEVLRNVYGYEGIELLDAAGGARLALGMQAETAEARPQDPVPLALHSGQVQMSDLYRERSGRIGLDFIAPLVKHAAGEPQTIGAVVLHAPVERVLFPLIQSWPTPSPSAETLLVRRDGDSVLYLNELRHRKGTALAYRLPLDTPKLPAAGAALTGKAQAIEGTDYRGVRVLAATRPVKDTAWQLVAKIDRDEVLRPLKDLVFWVSLVALAAVIAVAVLTALLWRQQQRAHRLELIAQAGERDRLLKRFFDLPFIGMTITSPASKRWVCFNDRLCEILGYPREELGEKTWADLTHPEDLAADAAQFQRVTASESDGYQMDKRFVRKDGSIIDATIDVRAVRRADASVDFFVATIQDITERKRAEQALADAEERFRLTVESAPHGVLLVDQNGTIALVNRALERAFGYSREELLGSPIEVLVPTNIRERHVTYRDSFLAQLQTRPMSVRRDLRGRGKDGGEFPVEVGLSPITTREGSFVLATVVDITERKRAEEALQRSVRRLQALHEMDRAILEAHTPQEVAAQGLEHLTRLIPYWGATAMTFDYSAGETNVLAYRRASGSAYDPGMRFSLVDFGLKDLEALKRGEVCRVSDLVAMPDRPVILEKLCRQGMRSYVRIPLRVESELVGALNVASDQSDYFTEEHVEIARPIADLLAIALQHALLRQRLEEEAGLLERRVAERTAELAAKNRELETFSYSVSHDLKAPLRGIEGYSRLLLDECAQHLDEDGRFFVQSIRSASVRMSELIDDLLAYSRLERRALALERVNPRTVVESLVAEHADDIRVGQVQVAVDVACESISAEPEGLAIALRNLVDNALKFSRDVPQPRVEIAGREQGNKCVLWVRDNGRGFDMQYHDRIFELFQRLNRAEDYPGTGIGLALVRKAVERMNGRVWAESAPGQGATFFLEIPN